MNALSLHQFFALYIWFPLTVALLFLLLIARFYEKFSGVRMYFRFLLLPIVLYGASAVRYASIERVSGDGLADSLSALAGLIVLVLCGWIGHQMLKETT